MKDSFPKKGTNFVPLNDRIVAERISAVVIEFPAKVLATVTDATVESAKNWRAGDNAPSLANAIKLARRIPKVKWLIHEMIEEGEEQVGSSRFVTELVTTLLRIAEGDSESASLAKTALHQMHRREP